MDEHHHPHHEQFLREEARAGYRRVTELLEELDEEMEDDD